MSILKIPTHIAGFDFVARGGVPRDRTTLVCGSAGSAKTVFAAQFLAEGIRQSGEAGVFVTFEEKADDIRRNMLGFGWDIAQWEAEGKWLFVDASRYDDEQIVSGDFDFTGLSARLRHALSSISAQRVSIDSLGAVFAQFEDPAIVRNELFRIIADLRKLQVTALITAERNNEYGEIARFGIEEFVADNVIILRNVLEEEKRRRTIEILKFRGTDHHKGEFPFTIIPQEGVVVIPLSEIQLRQHSSSVRISSGNTEVDAMCGGGFFRDSIILLSGATGTGKTLLTTEFINGGLKAGEKCLLFAFEESRSQLFRNANGWGIDFAKYEENGQLKLVCEYPEVAGLEDHLIRIKKVIAEVKPNRVAIDSFSALERIAGMRSFREFVIALTSFIKHQEIAGLFTSTTESLMGGSSVTETHVSTLTDSIILLRYVEMFGEMRRGLTVLKMRGSTHDKQIREFSIDGNGMHIGNAFRNVMGILSGNPTHISQNESSRFDELFRG